MPAPDDSAEIIVNGSSYRDWSSVKVTSGSAGAVREFTFTAVEKDRFGSWHGRRDQANQTGRSLSDYPRRRARNRRLCAGAPGEHHRDRARRPDIRPSKLTDAIMSSVTRKPSQYKNQTFETIAKDKLAPHGIGLKFENPPPGHDKKFQDVSAVPGETVFGFVARLARMRGLMLRDDENGDLLAGNIDQNKPSLAILSKATTSKSETA